METLSSRKDKANVEGSRLTTAMKISTDTKSKIKPSITPASTEQRRSLRKCTAPKGKLKCMPSKDLKFPRSRSPSPFIRLSASNNSSSCSPSQLELPRVSTDSLLQDPCKWEAVEIRYVERGKSMTLKPSRENDSSPYERKKQWTGQGKMPHPGKKEREQNPGDHSVEGRQLHLQQRESEVKKQTVVVEKLHVRNLLNTIREQCGDLNTSRLSEYRPAVSANPPEKLPVFLSRSSSAYHCSSSRQEGEADVCPLGYLIETEGHNQYGRKGSWISIPLENEKRKQQDPCKLEDIKSRPTSPPACESYCHYCLQSKVECLLNRRPRQVASSSILSPTASPPNGVHTRNQATQLDSDVCLCCGTYCAQQQRSSSDLPGTILICPKKKLSTTESIPISDPHTFFNTGSGRYTYNHEESTNRKSLNNSPPEFHEKESKYPHSAQYYSCKPKPYVLSQEDINCYKQIALRVLLDRKKFEQDHLGQISNVSGKKQSATGGSDKPKATSVTKKSRSVSKNKGTSRLSSKERSVRNSDFIQIHQQIEASKLSGARIRDQIEKHKRRMSKSPQAKLKTSTLPPKVRKLNFSGLSTSRSNHASNTSKIDSESSQRSSISSRQSKCSSNKPLRKKMAKSRHSSAPPAQISSKAMSPFSRALLSIIVKQEQKRIFSEAKRSSFVKKIQKDSRAPNGEKSVITYDEFHQMVVQAANQMEASKNSARTFSKGGPQGKPKRMLSEAAIRPSNISQQQVTPGIATSKPAKFSKVLNAKPAFHEASQQTNVSTNPKGFMGPSGSLTSPNYFVYDKSNKKSVSSVAVGTDFDEEYRYLPIFHNDPNRVSFIKGEQYQKDGNLQNVQSSLQHQQQSYKEDQKQAQQHQQQQQQQLQQKQESGQQQNSPQQHQNHEKPPSTKTPSRESILNEAMSSLNRLSCNEKNADFSQLLRGILKSPTARASQALGLPKDDLSASRVQDFVNEMTVDQVIRCYQELFSTLNNQVYSHQYHSLSPKKPMTDADKELQSTNKELSCNFSPCPPSMTKARPACGTLHSSFIAEIHKPCNVQKKRHLTRSSSVTPQLMKKVPGFLRQTESSLNKINTTFSSSWHSSSVFLGKASSRNSSQEKLCSLRKSDTPQNEPSLLADKKSEQNVSLVSQTDSPPKTDSESVDISAIVSISHPFLRKDQPFKNEKKSADSAKLTPGVLATKALTPSSEKKISLIPAAASSQNENKDDKIMQCQQGNDDINIDQTISKFDHILQNFMQRNSNIPPSKHTARSLPATLPNDEIYGVTLPQKKIYSLDKHKSLTDKTSLAKKDVAVSSKSNINMGREITLSDSHNSPIAGKLRPLSETALQQLASIHKPPVPQPKKSASGETPRRKNSFETFCPCKPQTAASRQDLKEKGKKEIWLSSSVSESMTSQVLKQRRLGIQNLNTRFQKMKLFCRAAAQANENMKGVEQRKKEFQQQDRTRKSRPFYTELSNESKVSEHEKSLIEQEGSLTHPKISVFTSASDSRIAMHRKCFHPASQTKLFGFIQTSSSSNMSSLNTSGFGGTLMLSKDKLDPFLSKPRAKIHPSKVENQKAADNGQPCIDEKLSTHYLKVDDKVSSQVSTIKSCGAVTRLASHSECSAIDENYTPHTSHQGLSEFVAGKALTVSLMKPGRKHIRKQSSALDNIVDGSSPDSTASNQIKGESSRLGQKSTSRKQDGGSSRETYSKCSQGYSPTSAGDENVGKMLQERAVEKTCKMVLNQMQALETLPRTSIRNKLICSHRSSSAESSPDSKLFEASGVLESPSSSPHSSWVLSCSWDSETGVKEKTPHSNFSVKQGSTRRNAPSRREKETTPNQNSITCGIRAEALDADKSLQMYKRSSKINAIKDWTRNTLYIQPDSSTLRGHKTNTSNVFKSEGLTLSSNSAETAKVPKSQNSAEGENKGVPSTREGTTSLQACSPNQRPINTFELSCSNSSLPMESDLASRTSALANIACLKPLERNELLTKVPSENTESFDLQHTGQGNPQTHHYDLAKMRCQPTTDMLKQHAPLEELKISRVGGSIFAERRHICQEIPATTSIKAVPFLDIPAYVLDDSQEICSSQTKSSTTNFVGGSSATCIPPRETYLDVNPNVPPTNTLPATSDDSAEYRDVPESEEHSSNTWSRPNDYRLREIRGNLRCDTKLKGVCGRCSSETESYKHTQETAPHSRISSISSTPHVFETTKASISKRIKKETDADAKRVSCTHSLCPVSGENFDQLTNNEEIQTPSIKEKVDSKTIIKPKTRLHHMLTPEREKPSISHSMTIIDHKLISDAKTYHGSVDETLQRGNDAPGSADIPIKLDVEQSFAMRKEQRRSINEHSSCLKECDQYTNETFFSKNQGNRVLSHEVLTTSRETRESNESSTLNLSSFTNFSVEKYAGSQYQVRDHEQCKNSNIRKAETYPHMPKNEVTKQAMSHAMVTVSIFSKDTRARKESEGVNEKTLETKKLSREKSAVLDRKVWENLDLFIQSVKKDTASAKELQRSPKLAISSAPPQRVTPKALSPSCDNCRSKRTLPLHDNPRKIDTEGNSHNKSIASKNWRDSQDFSQARSLEGTASMHSDRNTHPQLEPVSLHLNQSLRKRIYQTQPNQISIRQDHSITSNRVFEFKPAGQEAPDALCAPRSPEKVPRKETPSTSACNVIVIEDDLAQQRANIQVRRNPTYSGLLTRTNDAEEPKYVDHSSLSPIRSLPCFNNKCNIQRLSLLNCQKQLTGDSKINTPQWSCPAEAVASKNPFLSLHNDTKFHIEHLEIPPSLGLNCSPTFSKNSQGRMANQKTDTALTEEDIQLLLKTWGKKNLDTEALNGIPPHDIQNTFTQPVPHVDENLMKFSETPTASSNSCKNEVIDLEDKIYSGNQRCTETAQSASQNMGLSVSFADSLERLISKKKGRRLKKEEKHNFHQESFTISSSTQHQGYRQLKDESADMTSSDCTLSQDCSHCVSYSRYLNPDECVFCSRFPFFHFKSSGGRQQKTADTPDSMKHSKSKTFKIKEKKSSTVFQNLSVEKLTSNSCVSWKTGGCPGEKLLHKTTQGIDDCQKRALTGSTNKRSSMREAVNLLTSKVVDIITSDRLMSNCINHHIEKAKKRRRKHHYKCCKRRRGRLHRLDRCSRCRSVQERSAESWTNDVYEDNFDLRKMGNSSKTYASEYVAKECKNAFCQSAQHDFYNISPAQDEHINSIPFSDLRHSKRKACRKYHLFNKMTQTRCAEHVAPEHVTDHSEVSECKEYISGRRGEKKIAKQSIFNLETTCKSRKICRNGVRFGNRVPSHNGRGKMNTLPQKEHKGFFVSDICHELPVLPFEKNSTKNDSLSETQKEDESNYFYTESISKDLTFASGTSRTVHKETSFIEDQVRSEAPLTSCLSSTLSMLHTNHTVSDEVEDITDTSLSFLDSHCKFTVSDMNPSHLRKSNDKCCKGKSDVLGPETSKHIDRPLCTMDDSLFHAHDVPHNGAGCNHESIETLVQDTQQSNQHQTRISTYSKFCTLNTNCQFYFPPPSFLMSWLISELTDQPLLGNFIPSSQVMQKLLITVDKTKPEELPLKHHPDVEESRLNQCVARFRKESCCSSLPGAKHSAADEEVEEIKTKGFIALKQLQVLEDKAAEKFGGAAAAECETSDRCLNDEPYNRLRINAEALCGGVGITLLSPNHEGTVFLGDFVTAEDREAGSFPIETEPKIIPDCISNPEKKDGIMASSRTIFSFLNHSDARCGHTYANFCYPHNVVILDDNYTSETGQFIHPDSNIYFCTGLDQNTPDEIETSETNSIENVSDLHLDKLEKSFCRSCKSRDGRYKPNTYGHKRRRRSQPSSCKKLKNQILKSLMLDPEYKRQIQKHSTPCSDRSKDSISAPKKRKLLKHNPAKPNLSRRTNTRANKVRPIRCKPMKKHKTYEGNRRKIQNPSPSQDSYASCKIFRNSVFGGGVEKNMPNLSDIVSESRERCRTRTSPTVKSRLERSLRDEDGDFDLDTYDDLVSFLTEMQETTTNTPTWHSPTSSNKYTSTQNCSSVLTRSSTDILSDTNLVQWTLPSSSSFIDPCPMFPVQAYDKYTQVQNSLQAEVEKNETRTPSKCKRQAKDAEERQTDKSVQTSNKQKYSPVSEKYGAQAFEHSPMKCNDPQAEFSTVKDQSPLALPDTLARSFLQDFMQVSLTSFVENVVDNRLRKDTHTAASQNDDDMPNGHDHVKTANGKNKQQAWKSEYSTVIPSATHDPRERCYTHEPKCAQTGQNNIAQDPIFTDIKSHEIRNSRKNVRKSRSLPIVCCGKYRSKISLGENIAYPFQYSAAVSISANDPMADAETKTSSQLHERELEYNDKSKDKMCENKRNMLPYELSVNISKGKITSTCKVSNLEPPVPDGSSTSNQDMDETFEHLRKFTTKNCSPWIQPVSYAANLDPAYNHGYCVKRSNVSQSDSLTTEDKASGDSVKASDDQKFIANGKVAYHFGENVVRERDRYARPELTNSFESKHCMSPKSPALNGMQSTAGSPQKDSMCEVTVISSSTSSHMDYGGLKYVLSRESKALWKHLTFLESSYESCELCKRQYKKKTGRSLSPRWMKPFKDRKFKQKTLDKKRRPCRLHNGTGTTTKHKNIHLSQSCTGQKQAQNNLKLDHSCGKLKSPTQSHKEGLINSKILIGKCESENSAISSRSGLKRVGVANFPITCSSCIDHVHEEELTAETMATQTCSQFNLSTLIGYPTRQVRTTLKRKYTQSLPKDNGPPNKKASQTTCESGSFKKHICGTKLSNAGRLDPRFYSRMTSRNRVIGGAYRRPGSLRGGKTARMINHFERAVSSSTPTTSRNPISHTCSSWRSTSNNASCNNLSFSNSLQDIGGGAETSSRLSTVSKSQQITYTIQSAAMNEISTDPGMKIQMSTEKKDSICNLGRANTETVAGRDLAGLYCSHKCNDDDITHFSKKAQISRISSAFPELDNQLGGTEREDFFTPSSIKDMRKPVNVQFSGAQLGLEKTLDDKQHDDAADTPGDNLLTCPPSNISQSFSPNVPQTVNATISEGYGHVMQQVSPDADEWIKTLGNILCEMRNTFPGDKPTRQTNSHEVSANDKQDIAKQAKLRELSETLSARARQNGDSLLLENDDASTSHGNMKLQLSNPVKENTTGYPNASSVSPHKIKATTYEDELETVPDEILPDGVRGMDSQIKCHSQQHDRGNLFCQALHSENKYSTDLCTDFRDKNMNESNFTISNYKKEREDSIVSMPRFLDGQSHIFVSVARNLLHSEKGKLQNNLVLKDGGCSRRCREQTNESSPIHKLDASTRQSINLSPSISSEKREEIKMLGLSQPFNTELENHQTRANGAFTKPRDKSRFGWTDRTEELKHSEKKERMSPTHAGHEFSEKREKMSPTHTGHEFSEKRERMSPIHAGHEFSEKREKMSPTTAGHEFSEKRERVSPTHTVQKSSEKRERVSPTHAGHEFSEKRERMSSTRTVQKSFEKRERMSRAHAGHEQYINLDFYHTSPSDGSRFCAYKRTIHQSKPKLSGQDCSIYSLQHSVSPDKTERQLIVSSPLPNAPKQEKGQTSLIPNYGEDVKSDISAGDLLGSGNQFDEIPVCLNSKRKLKDNRVQTTTSENVWKAKSFHKCNTNTRQAKKETCNTPDLGLDIMKRHVLDRNKPLIASPEDKSAKINKEMRSFSVCLKSSAEKFPPENCKYSPAAAQSVGKMTSSSESCSESHKRVRNRVDAIEKRSTQDEKCQQFQFTERTESHHDDDLNRFLRSPGKTKDISMQGSCLCDAPVKSVCETATTGLQIYQAHAVAKEPKPHEGGADSAHRMNVNIMAKPAPSTATTPKEGRHKRINWSRINRGLTSMLRSSKHCASSVVANKKEDESGRIRNNIAGASPGTQNSEKQRQECLTAAENTRQTPPCESAGISYKETASGDHACSYSNPGTSALISKEPDKAKTKFGLKSLLTYRRSSGALEKGNR